jgi:hypothetical protein
VLTIVLERLLTPWNSDALFRMPATFVFAVVQRGKGLNETRFSYMCNAQHPGHAHACDALTCPQIPVPEYARRWCVP